MGPALPIFPSSSPTSGCTGTECLWRMYGSFVKHLYRDFETTGKSRRAGALNETGTAQIPLNVDRLQLLRGKGEASVRRHRQQHGRRPIFQLASTAIWCTDTAFVVVRNLNVHCTGRQYMTLWWGGGKSGMHQHIFPTLIDCSGAPAQYYCGTFLYQCVVHMYRY